MNKTLVVVGIVVLIVIILYSTFKGAYNTMVTKSQDTQAKWASVESQYQRRNDLYNSVVKVIQGSADFERGTLKDVIEARSRATSVTVDPTKLTPESIQQFQQAQDQFSSAFSRLLVVVEQYPTLQTTQQFRDFQTQIEGTENRINKSRDDFNVSVQDYNTYIKRFPSNLMAGMFGFSEKGYFSSNPGSENPPDIDFNMNSNTTTPNTQGN
ncbi:MAG: LemA family protein [Chitinophagales bacterium]|jgi:LemA protein|nr:LemA family protein [Chitinophagales bacterium]